MQFLGMAGIAQESAPFTLSLQQCENMAYENHQKVREAKTELEQARARKAQAFHASILPRLDIRNIWGPINKVRAVENAAGVLFSPDTSTGLADLRYFTDLEFNLVQPIYTFGKLSGLNSAAFFGVQIEEADLEKQKQAVQIEVRELYWGVLLGQELLLVADDAQKEIDKADQKLQDKLDEGSEEVSQSDLWKLQIFRYELNKQRREAESKLKLARSAMRLLLGLEENRAFKLDTEYIDPVEINMVSLADYLDMATQNRVEFNQLNAGLNAGRALVGAARSDFYPQFFLAGQIKYNFAAGRDDPKNPWVNNPTNFFRPGVVVGAQMNLNFLQTRDKVRLAEIEYRKIADKKEMLDDGVRLQVEKAFLEVTKAESDLQESQKAFKASENWLRSATMTFDLGIGEIKDLIDAFKAKGKMQAEYLQNIFRFNTSVAKLSGAVGRDLYPQ